MQLPLRCAVFAAILLATLDCTAKCTTRVKVEDSRIGFDGCISRESARLAIDKILPTTREIVIQSEGGDVSAAVELARAIRSQRLSLRIRGRCSSSCANYLMPAAWTVTVEEGSRIVLHGDARISTRKFTALPGADPDVLRQAMQIAQEEAAFAALVPKAAVLHDMQAIAFTDERVQLGTLECIGVNREVNWEPGLEFLTRWRFITEVVPARADELVARSTKPLPDSPTQAAFRWNPFTQCSQRNHDATVSRTFSDPEPLK